MGSLRYFVAGAAVLAAATVWLLPLPPGTRLFILVVLAFSAVFVFVDSTRKGKTFAAITIALLALYLGATAQRGVLLLLAGGWAPTLLGLGMVILPVVGAWALVREVLFGVRVQQLAGRLAEEGGLPEDTLPRTDSGRVDRDAADAEFAAYRGAVEEDPGDWRRWFRLSLAYDASGDRKRARRSMRDAVGIWRGRPPHALYDGEK
ncbi:hypothetical protein NBM05_03110 [Rothia sp. AR01]|uniref:Tetratricopeptide repeat protein n=1 Tax=Rothia santali TaxID=2949643 RepID=A0A9X2H967_9MICC|nr:hypothetical protein [Rothia santali]MCP3425046.1 hypothetical protein [Rothia santali]